jgi:hypothetical protein
MPIWTQVFSVKQLFGLLEPKFSMGKLISTFVGLPFRRKRINQLTLKGLRFRKIIREQVTNEGKMVSVVSIFGLSWRLQKIASNVHQRHLEQDRTVVDHEIATASKCISGEFFAVDR